MSAPPIGMALRVGLALLIPVATEAQEFHVDLSADRSVRFISRTTLEDFEGVTDRIDGFVSVPGGVRAGGPYPETRLYFEVDLASIDTGLGLRNRDNYLETDAFPFAMLDASVTLIEPGEGGRSLITAAGTLSIHGIENPVTIRCRAEPADGGAYRIDCRFPVVLLDHEIQVPRVMFMKLADEVVVEVGFTVREP